MNQLLARLWSGLGDGVELAWTRARGTRGVRETQSTRERRGRAPSKLLLAAIGALTVLLVLGIVVRAEPMEPIDRVDPVNPPQWVPPADGFRWSVPSRFGPLDENGIIDYHWDPATYSYDHAYVHPANFPVNFFGCQTQADAAGQVQNTYTWEEVYSTGATSLLREVGQVCSFTYNGWTSQGSHTIRLTVTGPAFTTPPGPFVQTVTIRDYLIVSIGDSYASGQGNPDKPLEFSAYADDDYIYLSQTSPAVWEDERCSRSSYAGPARAALALETEDPHTSVTFVSLACSGATISTDGVWDDDPTHTVGSGILGPYRGAVPPPGVGYDFSGYLPPQVQAVHDLVGDRQIDALVISGGGNDIGFANVVAICAANSRCFNKKVNNDFIPDDTNGRPLQEVVADKISQLDVRYNDLADKIHDPNSPWHLNVANVLITEYPNFGTGDDAQLCPRIVEDIALWPLDMSREELEWAIPNIHGPLNQKVREAVERQANPNGNNRPWHFVTGISSAFAGSTATNPVTPGHGYCASDRWIRTATESILMQGPLPQTFHNPTFSFDELNAKMKTIGTAHPTADGHQVYARQIIAKLHEVLSPTAPPTPPHFMYGYVLGNTTSQPGTGGWHVGSCIGNVCSSDKVVLTVTAQDSVAIRGVSLKVNGASMPVDPASGSPQCPSVMGCVGSLSPDGKTYQWTFEITQEGVYHLEYAARGDSDQLSTFSHEVRVDLSDPMALDAVPNRAPESNGSYRAPLKVALGGQDTLAGSGVARVEYSVDGGPPDSVSLGRMITLDTGGEHTVTYRAIDFAGRQSPPRTFAAQVYVVPPSGVTAIGAGPGHTCAVTSTGGVKCWGKNTYGVLGDGSLASQPAPVDVIGFGEDAATATDVGVGTAHSCALTSDGGVECWGLNVHGVLGDGTTTSRTSPGYVTGLGSGSGVLSLSTNSFHNCVVTSGGGVKCWGYDARGQLGDGTRGTESPDSPQSGMRATPVDVVGLSAGVTAVSAGDNHTCAVVDGGAKCWGANDLGQTGSGGDPNVDQLLAVDVVGLGSGSGVTAISAGASHTCAVVNGGVKCWGANLHGQLGDGTFSTSRATPVDVVGLTSGVTDVSAGLSHTCARLSDGGVKCWGYNSYGQLGNDTPSYRENTPVSASGFGGGGATATGIATAFHTCALVSDGSARCWGANYHGQIGDGTTTDRPSPVEVLGLGHFLDTTAPEISYTINGTPGSNGWYTGEVTVSWQLSDSESGVDSSSGCDATTLSADTAGVTLTCSATNGLGLSSSSSVTIRIDRTAPTFGGAATTSPNAAGWYSSDVTVHWTASDDGSGIDPGTVPADSLVVGEGTDLSAAATVKDLAGNVGSGAVGGINIDRTTPQTTSVGAAPSTAAPGSDLVVGATVSDVGGSQVAAAEYRVDAGSYAPMQAEGGSFGSATVTVTATIPAFTEEGHEVCVRGIDGAGNVGTASCVSPNPTPVVTGLSPTSAQVNSADLILIVDGSGFVDGTTIRWDGGDLTTTRVSFSQLSAVVPSGELSATGVAWVSVFSPTPGGGGSISLPFFVNDTGALVTGSDSGTSSNGSASASTGGNGPGTTGSVSATASGGEGTVTVAEYESNPGGATTFRTAGTYFDVYLSPGNTFASLTAQFCHLAGGTQIRWYGASQWVTAQPQTYDASTGCVTLTLNSTTSTPTLSQLVGSYFAVEDLSPSVSSIVVNPGGPVALGAAAVTLNTSFEDPAGALGGPYTVAIDWDDGTGDSFDTSALAVSRGHTYTAAGVYAIGVEVTDTSGGSGSATLSQYLVVYDPRGGFVTGGGWIDSPPGAYTADATLTGKAAFGFVSKYQKGASLPTGETEFQFKAGGLNFHSTRYDWLVVAGARAQYKGVGTINGQGSYGFLLTAVDGQVTNAEGVDKFRIKIWDLNDGGAIVYDSQIGADDAAPLSTAIAGGSIVIHK